MQQQGEKTEEATPHKISEARKKGSVAKSMELNAALSNLLAVGFWLAISAWLYQSVLRFFRQAFTAMASLDEAKSGFLESLWTLSTDGFAMIVPISVVLMVIAVAMTVVQVGLLWSSEPLSPDVTRLNPVQGFKKLFSVRMIFESVKISLKLLLICVVFWWGFDWTIEQLGRLSRISPSLQSEAITILMLKVMLAFSSLMLLFSLADFSFVRWFYFHQLRMTKQEVKDEYKKREGDPEVRHKRKGIQRELLKKIQALGNVKKADVVITNPTHYAVALHYDAQQMQAPEVIIGARGPLAAMVRQLARRHCIRLVQAPSLARRLYATVKTAESVPVDLYVEVAMIYRQIYKEAKEK